MRLDGFGGRRTNPLAAATPFPYSGDCQNVRTRYGILQKRLGKAKSGAGCLGVGGVPNANPITRIFEYLKPSTGVRYQIATSSTFWHRKNGAAWDIIASTLTAGGVPQFVVSKDLLIGVNGLDAPKKWDGTTFAALGGSPPVFTHIAPQAPRMIGTNGRSTYWWGNPHEPEIWGPLNYGYVGLDDGDNITALFPQPTQGRLLFCKRHCIYQMTGTDPLYYQVALVYDSTGVVGPMAIHTTADGRTFFLSHNDHAIYEMGQVPVKLTEDIQPDMDALNWSDTVIYRAALGSRDGYLYCSVPDGVSTVNNARIVIDLKTGHCHKDPSTADSCYADMAPDGPVKLYAGNSGNAAQVYELDTTNNDDGAAINAYYVTGAIDPQVLQQASDLQQAEGQAAWVEIVGTTSAYDLDFSFSWDGAAFSTAEAVSLVTATANERVPRRVGFAGAGSTLRLKFGNDDAGETFSVTGARLRFGSRGLL